MKRQCSEAVEWHKALAEEAKQCQFYSGCTNLPKGATITADGTTYKVCLSCFFRFKKEHPEIEVTYAK